MAPSQYLQHLRAAFEAERDPEKAFFMKKYMKNKFDFFGIKTPERKAISKKMMAEHGLPSGEDLKELCRLCFQAPEREVQYFVNDLLQRQLKKLDPSFLDLTEELIPLKSWWDSVDFLAPKIAAGLFLRFPEQIEPYSARWIASDNFWCQRAAIIFQLSYKTKTRKDLLFQYILRRAGSREFFVQKGAGWALREYSKTDPEAVTEFIKNNDLPKLTIREGMKWIKKKSVDGIDFSK